MVVGGENRGGPQVVRGDDRRSWGILSGRFFRRRVDPHRGRQIGRLWPSLDEALGMRRVGGGEDVLPMRAHRSGPAEVDNGGREEAEPAVTALVVVPAKKVLPERAAILDRSESFRKLGTVLERLELRFRERIVVGHLRAAVRL